MKVSVWDTYVKRSDGTVMHFDILVPSDILNESKIFAYGRDYLSDKPFGTGELTSRECSYCHVEKATQPVIDGIKEKGFYIVEMQNCN